MTIGGSTIAAELGSLAPWHSPAPPIGRSEREARLERARERLAAVGADALLVNAGPNLRYFTGITWSPTERLVAMLLPVDGKPRIVCLAFERGSLEAELAIDAELLLWEEDENPLALIADSLAPNAVLALDPLLPFHWSEPLRASFRPVSAAPVIDAPRMVKSPAELALMQHAKAMTLEVHRRAARILAPGIRVSTVKRFIDDAHRALGAAGSTFCAVQFGTATAYPHGLPGDQQLEEGQLVLIDTGCTVDGYHSYITRTYAFGTVDDEIRALWNLEKEAQAAAFDAVEPGAPCESVDAAARRVLERVGLGPDYRLPGLPHRTGHGIGLAIHEPAYLVRGDRTPLAPGMCFSNEPMIVVPERFGLRLEDHMYVTETGTAWFTEPQHAIDRPFA
ncbi:Xaa-Pro peptidase family protein [Sphingomonas psychrotolerans]|uniref:Xaa-Pro peptidase family protein n=1 Tax=Sphingomonas psychrotolerans TaxID=1327635 RepID=A0ABU3N5C3_9SPHN|nr:Xaa-Pro peptidase family protein [Sphingomonas psychrotolerans]MDT8759682.1 Xaa-Pro peptidase family protein [Sphingomonas psychrotolerans]